MYQGKEGWARKWTVVLFAVAAVVALAVVGRNVPWGGHLLEWLDLLLRWFHVVVGIGWIGSSFYFIWLEHHLDRANQANGVAGSLYSVHGGGFYYVQKYEGAPPRLPERLHWFQWEAYLTWVSGFCLLVVVYYANAHTVMVDVGGARIPAFLAVVLGLATLGLGWLLYDRLCRSKLLDNTALFTTVGFLLVAGLALVLSELLSGRAAYMHVGAMLGTIMAANVFFVIIPAHRVMVQAVREGSRPDPDTSRHASMRSLHNNYLTLPVIFVMISVHFPTTYTHAYNWAVLAGLFLASAGLRHYLNLLERGRHMAWILPAASLLVLALALVTAPGAARLTAAPAPEALPEVTFAEANAVIQTHCAVCHSATPSDDVFTSAPGGVKFDGAEQIGAFAERIYHRTVVTRDMPLGNVTGMTEEEREVIRFWFLKGARLD